MPVCLECGEFKGCGSFNRKLLEAFVTASFLEALPTVRGGLYRGQRIAVCTVCMNASCHLTGKPAAEPRDPVNPCVPCPSQVFPGGYIAWRLLESSIDGKCPRVIPSMCRFWEDGFCRNGDECRFAHHPLEIEAMRCRVRCGLNGLNVVIDWVHDEDRAIYLDDDDNTAGEVPTVQEEPRPAQPEGGEHLPRSTEQRPTCVYWQNVGSCKWGESCRFDHVDGERRRVGNQCVSSAPSKSAWQKWYENYYITYEEALRRLMLPENFTEPEKEILRLAEESRAKKAAAEEAKASCRSGSCRYCQIKKVFGTTNILANTCVYDGSNWGSCCKCARDRHGWTGFNQNACRHCSEGVREEKEDRLCVVSQTVDAGAVSR